METPSLSFATQFVRGVICKSVGGADAPRYAAARWPWSDPNQIAKAAAITASETSDRLADAFLDAVRERTALGRLPFRKAAFNTRTIAAAAGSHGYWVGEAKPIPLSKPALAGVSLAPLTVAALIAMTREALRDASPTTEAGIRRDLEAAVAAALDEAAFDPTNAGVTDERPGSLTYGATPVMSSGNDATALRTDVAALLGVFGGDVATAALLMSPRTALQISLLPQPLGNADLTVNGGSLFGLPVVTTGALAGGSYGDYMALIDCGGAAVALGRLDVLESYDATLVMADNPSAPSEVVSMFQSGTVALRATCAANWKNLRTGGVVLLTGVDYSAAMSP